MASRFEAATVYGVDFSGAKLAGRTTWLARLERTGAADGPSFVLTELRSLEAIGGTAAREAALARLVQLVGASTSALWGIDFPFSLPMEVMPAGSGWADQFVFLDGWGDGAYAMGLECLRRAKLLGGKMHIRRLTDIEEKAPFDAYHYRIIYQTFHGMRDVLGPLRATKGTVVLPFMYPRLRWAKRVLVEACPASTLKRLKLPHQNYKQPQGGPLVPKRRKTRRAILDGLSAHVAFGPRQRLVMMRDGGGDAMDAVIAAVGAARAWDGSDHRAIARHPRYPREGRLYVG